MVTPTVTTKVNNSNYDVSADQWNALIAATNASIAATKNQPYSYIIYKSGSTYYARNGVTGAVDYSSTSWGTVLNAAIAACSYGETVFVRSGVYAATAYVSVTMKSGVTVVGESMEGVQFTSTSYIIFRFNGISNATLANCYISHAGGTNIMSVYVHGTNSDYNTIDNIHFAGTATWAINVTSATGLTVKNCLMDTADIPIFLYVSGTLTQSKIVGNAVYDCKTGGIAVYVQNIVSSEISGNLFVNAVKSLYAGVITVSNLGGNSENFVISQNIISFTSDPPVTVNGIVVSGEVGPTYLIRGFTCSDNEIYVSGDVTAHVNVGIYLHGYSGASRTVQHGVVTGNTVTAVGALNYGLIVTQSRYITCNSNSVYNATVAGAYFDSATSNSILKANIFLDCAVGATNLGSDNVIGDNSGFVTENSGSSTGTGAQQTIAHGCGFTPVYNQVQLSERSTGGALAYQSAAPDATNIYVTATNLKDYVWVVKYNP